MPTEDEAPVLLILILLTLFISMTIVWFYVDSFAMYKSIEEDVEIGFGKINTRTVIEEPTLSETIVYIFKWICLTIIAILIFILSVIKINTLKKFIFKQYKKIRNHKRKNHRNRKRSRTK